MQNVFFVGKDITEIRAQDLARLKEAAMLSPLKRARYCVHKDHGDSIHEMIIAICRGSYVRPHRHRNKTESFHIIEGELLVIFFDDDGTITYRMKMAPCGSGETFFYRLSRHEWHMAIPLSEYAIVHEVTNGPFIKSETEFSPWSPKESDQEKVREYLSKIVKDYP